MPVTGDVANATQSIPAITCNSFTGDANDDVWYSFVAAATSETIEVTGSADFDAVVDLRDGCTGSTIDCADATLDGGTEQIVATGLTVGNTYYVRVYHYFTAIPATTDFDICVYHLAGDECTTAVTANDGANAFTTVGTPAAPDVTSCSTGDVFDTWFTYTATCTGTLVISTCDDATFNTSLGVYDACGGTELACNDDAAGCTGSTSEVSLSATSGEVFLIRVAGTGGATGSGNVNISCFPSVLYSQASGNTSDPIWDVVPVGTPGAAVFSPFTSVVVQNGDVVTADADLDVNDLTVETGATLVLDNGVTLSVHGSSLDVDGTLTGNDNSVLELVGTSATTMASAATLDLFDLTVNTPAGTTTDATIEVRGTLQLDGGAFDASAGDVTLISTATETARLGPVDATASYTGDLRVQRHVPAGVTNWRLLSGSVTGATLQQWDQDFLTAGFPGSDFPGFDNPVGSGILWPSIRVYDETDAGAGLTDGLEGVGNVTDALTTGVGFAAWCGDNLVSTTAFTIDVVGPPVVASTPVALPVSYTNTGVPATDGWNLVGNPLASPIDFGALSLGADVENEFWVFDPVAGNNVFWNETLGLGSSVMNGNIQSSQGFWLHATGAAVTTTVDESAKVLDPNGGAPFGGMLLQNDPILRLGLHSQLNQFSDETLLHFGAGQPDNDGPDMEKFFFAHPEAPQLWSSGADGVDLALNAWGGITAPVTIPVKVQTWVAGSYTLEVMQHTQPMDDLCVVLEDVVTGVSTPLETGASYSFTLASGVPADPARFLLHVAPAPQGVLTASAQQVLVGEPVQFSSGTQPGTPVSWEFGDGSTSTDPDPVHAYGLPGNYPVQLTIGQAPCDLVLTEVIEVSVSTDLPALDDEAFRAWMDGSAIRLRWDLGGADVHEVKVYDPRGREVRALRLAEASGQATIDMADQPHGVYVLRLQSDRLLRTVKLPVVR